MKCNSKQFKHIKPKLKKAGVDIFMISDFKDGCYLCFFSDKSVTNGVIQFRNIYTKIYDEWDEETFLKICGVEPKEKTYKITREQILKLHDKIGSLDTRHELRDMFPEVFETKLEVGKWYKSNNFNLVNYQGLEEKKCYGFGYVNTDRWHEKMTFLTEEHGANWIEATDQEVTEALTKEAVKRGFVVGASHTITNGDNIRKIENKLRFGFVYNSEECYLLVNNWRIFDNGQWAEILETITIQEAESKLKEIGVNAKIA